MATSTLTQLLNYECSESILQSLLMYCTIFIGNRCVQAAPFIFSLYSTYQTYLFFPLQNAAVRHVCKAKKSDHIHPILQILHWLPVTHLIQYKISSMLQFHLWQIPLVFVWSPSTLCSNKRIIICIRYPNLCYHLCKHNSIWWKSFLMSACLFGTVYLNLIYSSRPSRLPSRCNIVTISKLSVSQLCLSPPPPLQCVCVLLVLL